MLVSKVTYRAVSCIPLGRKTNIAWTKDAGLRGCGGHSNIEVTTYVNKHQHVLSDDLGATQEQMALTGGSLLSLSRPGF